MATQTLATKHNVLNRTIATNDICEICGNEREDEYHAVITCTRSKAVRNEMRAYLELPKDELVRYTGEHCLQLLLDPLNENVRTNTLLMCWEAWNLRNNLIHGVGENTVLGSVAVLRKFGLDWANSQLPDAPANGSRSGSLFDAQPYRPVANTTNHWVKPGVGTAKISTDAAFQRESCRAWAGVVARDAARGYLYFSMQRSRVLCFGQRSRGKCIVEWLTGDRAGLPRCTRSRS